VCVCVLACERVRRQAYIRGGAADRTLSSLLTCSAKNLDCCELDRSRMASTRDQACGCSCTVFSTDSAAARCVLRGGKGRNCAG